MITSPAAPLVPTTTAAVRRQIIRRLVEHGGGDERLLQAADDVDPTRDVSVDSLHMVEVVLELETDLGVRIPNRELTSERLRSVNAFASYLARKMAGKTADQAAAPGRRTAGRPAAPRRAAARDLSPPGA